MILTKPLLLILLFTCWEVCGKSINKSVKYHHNKQFDGKSLPKKNSDVRSRDVENTRPSYFGESVDKCFRNPRLTRRKSELLVNAFTSWAKNDPEISKGLPAAVRSLQNLYELPKVDEVELKTLRSTPTGVNCQAIPCGICAKVTSTGGIIQSPNFPYSYGNNMSCTYTIDVPSDKRIQLTFTKFSVEPEYDFVTVYDQTSIPLKVNLNGYRAPKPIISKTNLIRISFRSDMDNTHMPENKLARWEAKFNIYEESAESTTKDTNQQVSSTTTSSVDNQVLCKSSHCGVCKNVTPSGGIVESPNYPNDYGSNQTVLIYIRAPPGKIIRLTFTTFVVAENCDFLFVFDDSRFSVTNLLQGFLKGNILPQPIISKSNEMIVLFISNEDNNSISPNKRPARWQAQFEIEDPLLSVPPVIEEIENVGESIIVNGSKIDGSEMVADAPSINDFHSTDNLGSSFSNLVSLSKVTTALGGVTCIVTACGICKNVTFNGGIIQSPDYPNDYGNGRDCLFTIDVPVGYKIRLTFDTFVLEDCCDSISIYDGAYGGIQLQLGGYVYPRPSLTRSNQMNVRFISDFSNRLLLESGRWQAKFELVESNPNIIQTTTTISTTTQTTTTTKPTTTATTESSIPTTKLTTNTPTQPTTTLPATLSPIQVLCNISACGIKTEITSYGGSIESPNYPNDYGNNLDCLITIEVPKGQRITLNFIDFNIEKDYDKISVFDRISTPLRIDLSGHLLPSTIKTKTNKMTIVFKTDSDNIALPKNIPAGRWKATFSI